MLERLAGLDPLAPEDLAFDRIFPPPMQRLSARHWTPVAVARRAAALLVESEATIVLDVGAGVGKFCIVGAKTTSGHFVGVEQRTFLAGVAQRTVRRLGLESHVEIVEADALSLDWGQFHAFYFFNPFPGPLTDPRSVERTQEKLEEIPPGARVVTYHGFGGTTPSCFSHVLSEPIGSGRLEMFVRKGAT